MRGFHGFVLCLFCLSVPIAALRSPKLFKAEKYVKLATAPNLNLVQVYRSLFRNTRHSVTRPDGRHLWDVINPDIQVEPEGERHHCEPLIGCMLFAQPHDLHSLRFLTCPWPCLDAPRVIEMCLWRHRMYGKGYEFVEFIDRHCMTIEDQSSPDHVIDLTIDENDDPTPLPGINDTMDGLAPKETQHEDPESGGLWLSLCYFSRGRVSRKPVTKECNVPVKRWETEHEVELYCGVPVDWEKSLLGEYCSCSIHPKYITRRIHWFAAKINYGLVGGDVTLLLLLLLRWQCKKRRNKLFTMAFICMNIVWMMWRLQETLNWDISWRAKSPYVCIFTNYVRYAMEGGALYMFAVTSVHRLQAVSRPLQWYTRTMPRLFDAAAVGVGLVIGFVISTLNLAAILVMDNPEISKSCTMPRNPTNLRLQFLFVVKVLNLSIMFLLPFVVILATNTMTFFVLSKARRNKALSGKKKAASRETMSSSWAFLGLSSLIVAFFLPCPASELQMAEEAMAAAETGGRGARWSIEQVVGEGVLWNLTTMALIIITIAGIKFSPKNNT